MIEIVGKNGDAVTSVLAPAGPKGIDRESAKFAAGRPSDKEVNALLVASR